MKVLAETFYRLEVHNARYGVAVEEHPTLGDVLARLSSSLVASPRVHSIAGGRVILDGATLDGDAVRIVVSFYHRTTPPEDGWSAIDHLPRRGGEAT